MQAEQLCHWLCFEISLSLKRDRRCFWKETEPFLSRQFSRSLAVHLSERKIQNQIIFYISRCVLSWVSCEILRETQTCNLKSRRRGKNTARKISKQNCMILRNQKATLKLLLVMKQGFGVPCWPSTFWIRSSCQNSPQAHFLCCWVLLELNILTKADLISFLYSTIFRIFCSFTDITWFRFCA